MRALTVLMTTYNEKEEVFRAAIESILNQSFSDFDLLIVVDNPENKILIDLIEEYKKKDIRIRYLINSKNMGLPASLNRGIEEISTEYIARMDADDVACIDRLKIQMEFLKENPDIGLVGTNIIYMDENGNCLYNRGGIPENHKQIAKTVRYMNVFNHPTFLGKTKVFKENKYRNLRYSQDYDFTCRLIESGVKVANINKPLLMYRKIESVNPQKIVYQRITMRTIQALYKQGILCSSNIEDEVDRRMKKVNVELVKSTVHDVDEGMNYIRKKQYIKGLKKIVFGEKDNREKNNAIKSMLMYAFYKRYYRF